MLSAVQKSTFPVYEPRNPQHTGYHQCVQNHFEDLEVVWEDRHQSQYGFFRPYVKDVIYRYLECGDLHFGFARVRCESCGHEFLLSFHVSAATSARHAIRNEWSSSVNGCVKKYSNMCRTGNMMTWRHSGFNVYCGYYSNKARGMRKKTGADNYVPTLMEPGMTSTAMRRKWAQLIQKIYHVVPLVCPKCQGAMKIIAFIIVLFGDADIIRMILKHLGLWDTRNHDPLEKICFQDKELIYTDEYAQIPFEEDWLQ